MASRHTLSLCCSRGPSGSKLLSVLQSRLSPLLSPFTRTTSQWLLDASVPRDESGVSEGAPPSDSVCGSASGFAAPSRFSLLLESQCFPPSFARRRRAGRRPPLPLFGLLEGLLVRLSEGADFLPEAGEAGGGNHKVEYTSCAALLLRLNHHTDVGETEREEEETEVCSAGGTFGQVVEAGGGRDGGQVIFSDPQQVLALAAGVEAVLSQVSGGQEGTGVKILPWKLDNLLGFDPATIHELEALQVDNLKRARGFRRVAEMSAWFHCSFYTTHTTQADKETCVTDQNRGQPPEVQLLGG